jgi:CDP-paratose 2-epimerase
VDQIDSRSGEVYNVGGGRAVSASLAEMTLLCQKVLGRKVPIEKRIESHTVDIPLFLSDCRKVSEHFDWQPQKTVENIVEETAQWFKTNDSILKPLFWSGSRK